MILINLLLFIFILFNSSSNALAAPTKSKDAKSHKKDSSLNKVDTTPNLEDTDVFTVTSEANLYQNSMYENFDIDFSSTNGWDVQLSTYNTPVYQDPNLDLSYQADTFINVSRTFKLNNALNLILGSQNGTYLAAQPTATQWQNLDYSQVLWQVNSLISLRGGLYWANSAMSGTTDVLGYNPGFTVNILENRLTFQADYYSGQSSFSGAVVNLQYQVNRYFQSYMGVGVPEQNSGNEFYGIVGFTLSSRGLF